MNQLQDEQIRKNYPHSEKKSVIDYFHGIPIEDPYRGLEEIESDSVSSWIKAQNQLTDDVLNNFPERDAIKKRLTQLQYRDEVLEVKQSHGCLFFLKKLSTKEQPVLYFQPEDTEERILIDVNKIDPAGTTSLDYFFPSHNGKTLAYGLSKGGSEWSVLHLIDVSSGEPLSEKIERAKWSEVRWTKNDSAFYYTRFPKPGEVPPGEEVFGSHIRFHKLGTDPDLDPVIFDNPENPQEYPLPELSPDDSFMLVRAYRFVSSDLHFIDLTTTPPKKIPIVTESQWLFTPLISHNHVYIYSNHKSSHFGLYRAEKENLQISSWETTLEPETDILQDVQLVSDKIIALWLHDVKSKVTLHDLDGALISEIPLPKSGTVDPADKGGGFRGGIEHSDVYFNCMSFFQAQTTYQFNIPSGELKEFFKMDLNLESSKYEITEEWYESRDGTRVHMFILHPSQFTLTGDNLTLLYGYGGFNISMTPFFSPNLLYWVEQGGIAAIANIRGGGEHGAAWHKAGILSNKQNVFDDFIAAAEHLIQRKYCSSKTLAILGGSNGGLLVGAVTTQRPELFTAVYCVVPLLDMLRYHHFSIGKTWIPEYGNPEKAEEFQWLRAYSPYQNIQEDVVYPAILFRTALNDSRVDPTHAFKMTALMQNLPQTTNPILLWTESEAGHGAGSSVAKLINEGTQMLSFFLWRMKDS
ncbi:MAG: prolyl oligopeptidase family protein [Promethearchaeota archaeon]